MLDTPKRLSRRARGRTYKKVQISRRDVEIFKLLSRYRFMRGNYLHALLSGHKETFIVRLGELYRTHYLNRPEQQWNYFNSNYRYAIYELDDKGKELLGYNAPEPIAPFRHLYNEFAHNLMLCDVLANLEIGAKRAGVTLTSCGDIQIPCKVSAQIGNRTHTSTTPLIPDAVFYLTYPDGKKLYFALEVDCGTEPVERSNLSQSSYKKKVLQYKEVLTTGAFKPFAPHLWILHVTNSPARKEHIKTLFGPSKSNMFNVHPVLGDFSPDPIPDGSLFGAWERVGHQPFQM